MAIYQQIQSLLLLGARLPPPPPAPLAPPPPPLERIVQAIEPSYHRFNQRALLAGNRYRGAFWSIYLLSALAILCAVLPMVSPEALPGRALRYICGGAEVLAIAIVGLLVWAGGRRHWHAQWIAARTRAELAWYLPLLAPLVPWSRGPAPTEDSKAAAQNWYVRVFGGAGPEMSNDDVGELCAQASPLAAALLRDVWDQPAFCAGYAAWAASVFEGQRNYHHCVVARQRALMRRTGRINSGLFALTALGALLHLMWEMPPLLLLTIFFPALGASLHGALAQSEAFRLALTSERLSAELGRAIGAIRAYPAAPQAAAGEAQGSAVVALQEAVGAAIGLVLEEHEDWHMLVRPHHLPLA